MKTNFQPVWPDVYQVDDATGEITIKEESKIMHYKNGREARVGDIVIGTWGGSPCLGEIVEILPNGKTANIRPIDIKTVEISGCVMAWDVVSNGTTSSPPSVAPEQPPIDNDHVAEGCEKFSEPKT